MNNYKNLLEYLGSLDYDKDFIESRIFPDWFCEEFFEECEEGAIITALVYGSRGLGLDFSELVDGYYSYIQN